MTDLEHLLGLCGEAHLNLFHIALLTLFAILLYGKSRFSKKKA